MMSYAFVLVLLRLRSSMRSSLTTRTACHNLRSPRRLHNEAGDRQRMARRVQGTAVRLRNKLFIGLGYDEASNDETPEHPVISNSRRYLVLWRLVRDSADFCFGPDASDDPTHNGLFINDLLRRSQNCNQLTISFLLTIHPRLSVR